MLAIGMSVRLQNALRYCRMPIFLFLVAFRIPALIGVVLLLCLVSFSCSAMAQGIVLSELSDFSSISKEIITAPTADVKKTSKKKLTPKTSNSKKKPIQNHEEVSKPSVTTAVIVKEKSEKKKTKQGESQFTLLPPKIPVRESKTLNADTSDYSSASSLKPDMMDPIGLQEAVGFALSNNDELKSYVARQNGAYWDAWGAYALYMPSIEFSYAEGAEKSSPGSYNDSTGSRVNSTRHHRRDRSFYLRQPIIDLAVVSEIMRTEKTVDVTQIEAKASQDTIVFETVQTYLKLVEAKSMLKIVDEHMAFLNDLAKRMKDRYDAGGATDSDLNRIASRLNIAKAARIEAVGQYGINISTLKRLTKVVPKYIKMPTKLVPVVPSSVQDALKSSWTSNPSYLSSLKKIEVAESDRNKSFAGAFPKLSVEYSDTYVYNAGGSAHGNPIDGVYPNQRDKRIMLVAKWSLTGGTTVTSGLSGVEKMREMKWKANDVKARLEQGLHTAYDAINSDRRRVSILKDNYLTDQSIVRDIEDQFMNGGRSLFEILDSQDRLFSNKTELLRAMISEALVSYQVRLQMGEIAQAVLELKDNEAQR